MSDATLATTTAARSSWRTRLPALLRRARRWALIAIGIGIVAPWLLILPLNFAQPVTTMVMLRRTVQRAFAKKSPMYPRRDVVGRDEISAHLRRAVLASEDDRFYLHFGFDLEEIDNALERARRGRRLRGASTITQQVAKNIFLWEGRSYVRKGYEAYLTLVLEVCLPKDRILDLYLNLAEWGDGVFGAEMAARRHFKKSAKALTMDEAARLAAVLPSPVRWSPSGAVAARRSVAILERMRYAAPRE
ncbi:MAG: monofunctional biosynthetic peptidoglycan transglycosylase [Gemmatimonadaceae bacterium]